MLAVRDVLCDMIWVNINPAAAGRLRAARKTILGP
jgi:hypothetical protein